MGRKDEIFRECALTRETKPTAELIRFVVGPDNVLVPDIDAQAEGRGVWVTATEQAVTEAQRKKAFAKSLKAKVTVPEDLPALTRKRLEQRLLGALSMSKKAGQMITGAAKVRSAIESNGIIALISATDAAEDGKNKLVALLRGLETTRESEDTVPHLELLSSDQLGLALGGENVIHAALAKGAAAQSALARARKLAAYSALNGKSETRVHG